VKTVVKVILLLSFLTFLNAQTTSIKGTVTDSESGKPIAGAEVQLVSGKIIATTDHQGKFQISNVLIGEQVLELSHVGYKNVRLDINLLNEQDLELSVKLVEAILHSVEEIITEADRPGPHIGLKIDSKTVAQAIPDDIGNYFRQFPNTCSIKKGAFCGDPVIRGTTGDQLNLQVDNGIKVVGGCPNRMDPATAHMQSEDLQMVEVFSGPYTVRFGPNMSGLVNMVMQKPQNYNRFELHSSLEGGFETISEGNKARLTINGGSEKINFYLNGGYKNFRDYKDAKGNKVPANYYAQDYSLKLGVNFTATQRLQFSARESRHKDVSYPALPMDAQKTNTHIYALDYFAQTRNQIIPSIRAKFYVADVEHIMTNLTRPDRGMDGLSDTETDNLGGRLELELKLFSLDRFYVGSEIHHLRMNGIRQRDGRPGTMMFGKHFEDVIWPQARNNHLGIFAEMIKAVNSRVLLTAGTRFDADTYQGRNFDQSFLSFYPDSETDADFKNMSLHFGAEYSLSDENSISLKLGQGIRSPAVKELYINRFNIGRDGFEYLGNPELKPEQNRQIDVAFSRTTEKYELKTSVFYSSMKNFISAKHDPTIAKVMKNVPGVKRIINLQSVFRTGAEVRFDYHFSPALLFSNSIGYTYAQNSSFNEPLMEIPPLEYNMTATYNFLRDKGYLRLDGRWASAQNRISSSFAETQTPGFNVWNLSLSFNLTNSISMKSGIENIFNKYYYEHLNRTLKYTGMTGMHLYEPGRNVFFYLKYGF